METNLSKSLNLNPDPSFQAELDAISEVSKQRTLMLGS